MKAKLILLSYILLASSLLQAQKNHLTENFNAGSLPSGWTQTAISGVHNWKIGLDGSTAHSGSQNLNGSSMAYFDDDALGGASTDNKVSLTSPIFDNSLDLITTLEFDYNFREFGGTNVPDSFYVEVYDGSNWNTVFSVSTDNCGNYLSGNCVNNYPQATVDISSYANTNCQLRFTYYDGDDWGWYVGLDNIMVFSPFPYDIQVSEIVSHLASCGLTNSEKVEIEIKNIGSLPVTSSFSVVLDINNGGTILTDTISSPILAGDSITYTFKDSVDFSTLGSYVLKSFTVYPMDSNVVNDTIHRLIIHEPLFTLPYLDDFEGTNNWSTFGSNNSWELGIPSAIFIDTAASGTKAYVTNLSGNYNNNETSYLTSPCLDFSSSLSDPYISFDIIYQSEQSFDSLVLESSVDGGNSWQKVKPYILSENFYDANRPFWDSSSSGWINVKNRLTHLNQKKNVKLRFKFSTDGSGTREGFGIDNFEITDGPETDLMLTEIVFPNQLPACFLDNSYLSAKVINLGKTTLDTFYLFYRANGGILYVDTITNPILTSNITTITSLRKVPLIPLTNHFDLWISTPRDSVGLNDSIINHPFINNTFAASHFPYIEDFDSFHTSSSYYNNFDSLKNGWQRNASSSSHYYTWRVAAGSLKNNTGPLSDVTGDNYLYTESSHGNVGDEATLTSPCIQLNQHENIVLGFYTHRFGINIDTLFVDFYDGIIWNTVDTITAQPQTTQNSLWTKHELKMNVEAFSDVKIRFRTKKIGHAGYIGLDKVQLYVESDLDAAITELVTPPNQCYLTNNEVISTTIVNDGIQDILPNTLTVSYKINNGVTINEVITDTIKPDTTFTYSFTQTADLSNYGATYSLIIFSSLIGDYNILNDTLKTKVANLTNTIGYKEDFENTNERACIGFLSSFHNTYLPLGWEDSNKVWFVQNTSNCNFNSSQGATQSNFTGPDAAHSGTNFLYFETSHKSFQMSYETIKKGCFDFVNDSSITLEFWYHKYGVRMENLYIDVINNQGVLSVVDSIIGQTHLSGSAPWLKKTISLDSFAGKEVTIQFRAESFSSYNPHTNNMAIDDIRIFNPLTISLEKPKIQKVFSLYPNPNNGLFTLKVSNETVGAQYKIFDMKGSLIKSERINSPTSQIRLDEVNKEIYFIQIENLGRTEKIVVQ